MHEHLKAFNGKPGSVVDTMGNTGVSSGKGKKLGTTPKYGELSLGRERLRVPRRSCCCLIWQCYLFRHSYLNLGAFCAASKNGCFC